MRSAFWAGCSWLYYPIALSVSRKAQLRSSVGGMRSMLENYARARRIRKKVRPKHSDLARHACEARAELRQQANREVASSARLIRICHMVTSATHADTASGHPIGRDALFAGVLRAVRQGLRDLGYVEVRNIAFERWCSEHKGLSDAPIKQPPAISNRHPDQDFVGSRRVAHVGVGCRDPEKSLSANRS